MFFGVKNGFTPIERCLLLRVKAFVSSAKLGHKSFDTEC